MAPNFVTLRIMEPHEMAVGAMVLASQGATTFDGNDFDATGGQLVRSLALQADFRRSHPMAQRRSWKISRSKLSVMLASVSFASARASPIVRMNRLKRCFWWAKTCSTVARIAAFCGHA